MKPLRGLAVVLCCWACADAFVFGNISIREAVLEWQVDAVGAETTYGHISGWNTSGVTDMSGLFAYLSSFNEDIGSWDTGNVLTMDSMFEQATSFDGDVGRWNTSGCGRRRRPTRRSQGSVIGMRHMFKGAAAFNQDIGNWDTGKVATTEGMFMGASAFNQDIGKWDTGNVDDMREMFADASAFNQDISKWDVSNVRYMGRAFANATSFNQDIGNWDTSRVIDIIGIFDNATAFDFILCWSLDNVGDYFFGNYYYRDLYDDGYYYTSGIPSSTPTIAPTLDLFPIYDATCTDCPCATPSPTPERCQAVVDGNVDFDSQYRCLKQGDNDSINKKILAKNINTGQAGVRCCNDRGKGISLCETNCEHVSFDVAHSRCANANMRLCSTEEILNVVPAKTGCWYDIAYVWSSDSINCDAS